MADNSSYDKRRTDLRDLMARLLQNADGHGYAGDVPGESADRVLNLLGITPDSVIVTPGDGSGTIDTIYGLTLLAHEHHGGHLDGMATCDAPWCLRGKAVLARLDPSARVAGQPLTPLRILLAEKAEETP